MKTPSEHYAEADRLLTEVCFRDGADDDYQPGRPPPCGHWHPEVPRTEA